MESNKHEAYGSCIKTPHTISYYGTKEMLFVDEAENKEYLSKLFKSMYDKLPVPMLK